MNVYQKIMLACGRKEGLTLTPKEVTLLATNDFVYTRGEADGTCAHCMGTGHLQGHPCPAPDCEDGTVPIA